MNISIKATNLELTPAIKDYTEKRLGKSITKFATDQALIEIELAKTTNHHNKGDVFMAEVMVTNPLGKTYRSVAEKSDLYEAIDVVRDQLIDILSSSKDKQETLFKRGSRKIKSLIKGW